MEKEGHIDLFWGRDFFPSPINDRTPIWSFFCRIRRIITSGLGQELERLLGSLTLDNNNYGKGSNTLIFWLQIMESLRSGFSYWSWKWLPVQAIWGGLYHRTKLKATYVRHVWWGRLDFECFKEQVFLRNKLVRDLRLDFKNSEDETGLFLTVVWFRE